MTEENSERHEENDMHNLLNGIGEPVAERISFLDAPIERIIEAELNRYKKDNVKQYCDSYSNIALKDALNLLLPFGHRKSIVMSTQSKWQAILSDPTTNISYYIAPKLNCPCVDVIVEPFNRPLPDQKNSSGILSFGYTRNFNTDGLVDPANRYISIDNENLRLKFRQQGEALPFEQTDRYTAKCIADRLTLEMIIDYCRALDIRIDDEDFYGPTCHVINQKYTFFNPAPEKGYDWKELRRRNGINLN